MIRRRPIPRSAYRWQPRPKKVNVLRYELILGGAIRVYPGKREVCQDNASGRRIYADRVREMVQRQDYRCSLCGGTLCAALATFEHTRRRGMHAAFRDDRIIDEAGNWMNSAAHWECNSRKG